MALRRTVAAYNADRCGSFANAIAYNVLLALVPLTVLLLAVAGLVLRDPSRQEHLRGVVSLHFVGGDSVTVQDDLDAIMKDLLPTNRFGPRTS